MPQSVRHENDPYCRTTILLEYYYGTTLLDRIYCQYSSNLTHETKPKKCVSIHKGDTGGRGGSATQQLIVDIRLVCG